MYIWNLDNRQLIQVIELPDKVKAVKEIHFVTNSMAMNQHQVKDKLNKPWWFPAPRLLRFLNHYWLCLSNPHGFLDQWFWKEFSHHRWQFETRSSYVFLLSTAGPDTSSWWQLHSHNSLWQTWSYHPSGPLSIIFVLLYLS